MSVIRRKRSLQTAAVCDILQCDPSVVYSHRIITVLVNDERMRSLFMISVIYRKRSYMTAVNDHCKQPSFFVVNDWGTAVYDRA